MFIRQRADSVPGSQRRRVIIVKRHFDEKVIEVIGIITHRNQPSDWAIAYAFSKYELIEHNADQHEKSNCDALFVARNGSNLAILAFDCIGSQKLLYNFSSWYFKARIW